MVTYRRGVCKGDKGGKNQKKTLSYVKGVKYCQAFNGKNGCKHSEKQCPAYGKHACSVQTGWDQVCGNRNHGAASHQ